MKILTRIGDKAQQFFTNLTGGTHFILEKDKPPVQMSETEYQDYKKKQQEKDKVPLPDSVKDVPPPPVEKPTFADLMAPKPPDDVAKLIVDSANKFGVDPNLLAAVLFQESRYNPKAVGGDPNDRGIAQINSIAFPNVSSSQAFDPSFAIPFAAKKLADDIAYFEDVNRGIAAYNVGRGGASIKGPEAFGGGPKGQKYINNVSRNLSEDLIKNLGLSVTP